MKHLAYIFLAIVFISSCNDLFDDQNISGYITTDVIYTGNGISENIILLGYDSTIYHLHYDSQSLFQWQVENIPDWLQISLSNTNIVIEATENSDPYPRFATVYLKKFYETWKQYDTINIVQYGYNKLQPLIIPPEADTSHIYINSNADIKAVIYDKTRANPADWCTAKISASDVSGYTHKITLITDDYYNTPDLTGSERVAHLAILFEDSHFDDDYLYTATTIDIIKEAPYARTLDWDLHFNHTSQDYSVDIDANFNLHAICNEEWIRVSCTRKADNSNYYTISIDIDEYATTGTEERVANINLCYFRKDTGTYITVGTIECTQTPPSWNYDELE